MKFIDLSIPIINPEELLFDPPLTQPHVEYNDHQIGAEELSGLFRKLDPKNHLPDGKGWATEKIILTTHSGTHMDAPWHYAPVQDKEIGMKKAKTIDEFPLEWGMGPLIVLNCTEMKEGYVLTPSDIDDKLKDIDHQLKRGDIVCVHTNAPKHVESRQYTQFGIGIGKEATLHLIRHGVHVVGTDAWSWDAPFTITAKKWKESLKKEIPDTSIIWEGHYAGIELGYYQMEKLANLDKVPPTGATIYCFPVKIARASAGWVRAVATIPD